MTRRAPRGRPFTRQANSRSEKVEQALHPCEGRRLRDIARAIGEEPARLSSTMKDLMRQGRIEKVNGQRGVYRRREAAS